MELQLSYMTLVRDLDEGGLSKNQNGHMDDVQPQDIYHRAILAIRRDTIRTVLMRHEEQQVASERAFCKRTSKNLFLKID
jgi:hypothetical protein